MTKILTISLPEAMAQEIDLRTRGRRGRSEWIRGAIQSQLNGNPNADLTVIDATTRQLMAALKVRQEVHPKLKDLLAVLL